MKALARVLVPLLAALCVAVIMPATANAASDPFYRYSGTAPLASLAPGTVLATRTMLYHLANVPTPLRAVQILYRTTNALGEPAANVTSVLTTPNPANKGVVSYQSAYDSLNPEDSPSRAVAGDTTLLDLTPRGRNVHIGGAFANAENTIMPAVLALGYAVNIPDTEGQRAHFAAGPEYGTNTLDSLRALSAVAATGVSRTAPIGLVGYSGGAIASNWAAMLAPSYAPDVNSRLVGVAQGGLLVNPSRNLRYVSGSLIWAGAIGMAINGVGRAYGIDIDKYLNPYGKQIIRQMSDASILNFVYPGLTWEKLAKPEYKKIESIPEFVEALNKINMGTAPVPAVPMFIAQAANGILEGTAPGPVGIGPGDGVMIVGDVRALAHRYCRAGLPITYHEYGPLSHTLAVDLWAPESVVWLLDRFARRSAPTNCGQIAPGSRDAFSPQRGVR